MLVRFKEHINGHFPFLKNKKILVAVSGGVDSVVLTHVFHQLKFTIVLAHCNFSLRGKESDVDEHFVKSMAKQLGLPVHTITFDTHTYAKKQKVSIQMAARELRYAWFETLRIETHTDYIATGHHLDDNLETFIINFTRGTGLNGLTGIPEFNGNIIRPLLPFSKREIETYATEHDLSWREDASNTKTAYQRNKIRHQIVPLLKEMNPNLLASFQRTTQYLNESQQIIADAIEQVKERVVLNDTKGLIKINIQKLKHYDNPKAYLFELLKTYGFSEWNDVSNLLNAQSGKQLVSTSHRLVKDRDFLLLTEINAAKAHENLYEIKKNQPKLEFEESTLLFEDIDIQEVRKNTPNTVFIDKDVLCFPLTLRKMRHGDYFYPIGMGGKKKISKFFKDEKLSLIAKEHTWLLCSKNEVVWVVNRRLDDRYKVNQNTEKVFKIEFLKD